MSEKKPYDHQGDVAGSTGESAESEHRDTARPAAPPPNEIDVAERNREEPPRRTTRQDTRIDPDPRFEDENGEHRGT
jgi:hypothetical protein